MNCRLKKDFDDNMVDLTALGNAVKLESRFAGQASAGELIVSESTAQKADMDTSHLERRRLDPKGKSETMDRFVMTVARG